MIKFNIYKVEGNKQELVGTKETYTQTVEFIDDLKFYFPNDTYKYEKLWIK